MALKDVSTAFLQSEKYSNGMCKYLSIKNPITGEILYFRQDGPIYGEASAPARWENTIAPWLEEHEPHMRTHISSRQWCPVCIRGKAENKGHVSVSKSVREIPMMAYDYMKQRTEAIREGKIFTKPTLVGIDYDAE